ncbi:MAG: PfkB family carbohydrate kinase [Candidatus Limnocylindrales bacterium]|nr:PfkB family carbohydrate kinase [Candidatus Limnocylindrales bacterium]
MPSIHRPTRLRRPRRPGGTAGQPGPPRIVILGDLALDVVVAPSRPLESGTDVAGRVAFVQGGSAANTARWLGRLGARTTLIAAVGRDPTGRALVDAVRGDGVKVRVSRIAGARTARIGVLVSPDGERSFVADRGAADLLDPADLKSAWFAGAQALHLPVYSLLGAPLGAAGRRALELARDAGAIVSVDLASIGPLMTGGRRAARELIANTAPDILFATASETDALLGGGRAEGLLEFAQIAVIKRGSKGATVLARAAAERLRFEVVPAPLTAIDTTGAGDAFDAGFLVGWFAARSAGRSLPAALQRAALAGHHAAARQLSAPRPELALG